MATYRGSPQCAGTSIGAHRHICAFFTSLEEEHRVLGSFYEDGFDRGEKATHIVDAEHREEYLKRLAAAGMDVQRMMEQVNWRCCPGPTCMCATTGSTRMPCWLQWKR
jgi:hypothetical protein